MTLKHYVKGRCNNPHEAAAAVDALYRAHHPYGLLFCKKKATACKMQTVASYISRRFFVGNCCKFVVNSSDCHGKALYFQGFAVSLSTCRPSKPQLFEATRI